jgi:hypothetical protein
VRALGRELTRGRRRRRATRLRSRSRTCHPRRRRRCPTGAAGPLAVLKTLVDSPAGLEKAL